MSAKGIPLKSDFWERARVNDIPVAGLIGFEAREIADDDRYRTLERQYQGDTNRNLQITKGEI
jgi:hypothetical protein